MLGVPAGDPTRWPRAYRLLAERAGDALEGVLVEEMIAGNRELLVGLKRDPVFGPVVAFGLGGVLTEVLGDVALAARPPSERDVAELPDLIRAKKLLGPFRGLPPSTGRRSQLVIRRWRDRRRTSPRYREIDINPLLVDGDRPVAADALVILGARRRRPRPWRARSIPTCGPSSPRIRSPSSAPRTTSASGAARRSATSSTAATRGRSTRSTRAGGVFFGVQAYPSLADLPEAPDLALLAVGGAQVKGVLEECGTPGRAGRRGAHRRLLRDGRRGRRARARDRPDRRPSTASPSSAPTAWGCMSNEKRLHATGFRRPASPRWQAQLHLPIGQHGPDGHQHLRAAGHRHGQVHQRGQRGAW